MNISLLLLVLAKLFIASVFSLQVLRIDNYQYQSDYCGELNIEKQHNSKFISYSSSSACGPYQLFGGNYVKLDTCLNFNGEQTLFQVDSNGNIVKSIYNDPNCSKGIVKQITSNVGQCISDCSSYPIIYSVVNINDIDPYYYSSVVGITFGGDCNSSGNWQDTFISSYHYFYNECISLGPNSSMTFTCNATSISESSTSSSNTCSNIETKNDYNVGNCNSSNNGYNIFTLCNLF